ncbi:hypothetical protein EV121DRAFT_258872 [Schizophyllum commune]
MAALRPNDRLQGPPRVLHLQPHQPHMSQRTQLSVSTGLSPQYRAPDTFLATSVPRADSSSSQTSPPATQSGHGSLSPAPRHLGPRPQIFFYDRDKPHYGFTNFSPHPVKYKDAVYPTSEHLFQAFKFMEHQPRLAEHIRRQPRPRDALSEARRFDHEKRRDWFKVNIDKMDEALYLKFTQHKDLQDELLSTGNAELIDHTQDSPVDAFWGIGKDGRGRNELGKALGRLRKKLRRRTTYN